MFSTLDVSKNNILSYLFTKYTNSAFGFFFKKKLFHKILIMFYSKKKILQHIMLKKWIMII